MSILDHGFYGSPEAWMDAATESVVQNITLNPFFDLFFRPSFNAAWHDEREDERDERIYHRRFVHLRNPPPPEAAHIIPLHHRPHNPPGAPIPSYRRMHLTWPPIAYVDIFHMSELGADVETVAMDGKGQSIFGEVVDEAWDHVRGNYSKFEEYDHEEEYGHCLRGIHVIKGVESLEGCATCRKKRVNCECYC
jgi:hypothetical protein